MNEVQKRTVEALKRKAWNWANSMSMTKVHFKVKEIPYSKEIMFSVYMRDQYWFSLSWGQYSFIGVCGSISTRFTKKYKNGKEKDLVRYGYINARPHSI